MLLTSSPAYIPVSSTYINENCIFTICSPKPIDYKNQNFDSIFSSFNLTPFIDDFFPPSLSSLISNNLDDSSHNVIPPETLKEYRSYTWVRLKDIYDKEKKVVFKDPLAPNDIKQGNIGSCFIMVVLSGLLSKTSRLKRLYESDQVNDKGVYCLKLLLQGEVSKVVVDDFVPVNEKDELAFSSSKRNEIWLILAEKAWAKVNQSCYAKIYAGKTHEAFNAFTQAPCFMYQHKKYTLKKDELWERLFVAHKKGFILSGNTEEVKNKEIYNLTEYHAYAIISLFEERNNRLVKLRNPVGDKQWSGDFSETSKSWSMYLKVKCNYEAVDGIFFMNFEDYVKHFAWTFVCNYHDDFKYSWASFEFSANQVSALESCNWSKVAFKVTSKMLAYISLNNPQERQYPLINNFINPIGQLILFKLDAEGKRQLVKYEVSTFEKISIEVELEEGHYQVFGRVKWLYEEKYKAVISVYSSQFVQLYKLNFTSNIFCQKFMVKVAREQGKMKQVENNCYEYLFLPQEGRKSLFGALVYENYNEAPLKVRLKFGKLENASVLSEKVKRNMVEKEIKPFCVDIVLIEYTDLPWKVKVEVESEVWVDYPFYNIIKRHLFKNEKLNRETSNNMIKTTIQFPRGKLFVYENKCNQKIKVEARIRKQNFHVVSSASNPKEEKELVVFELNKGERFYFVGKIGTVQKEANFEIEHLIVLQ